MALSSKNANVTAKDTLNGKATLSKIGSIRRDWEDDEKKSSQPSSQATVQYSWGTSPQREAKGTINGPPKPLKASEFLSRLDAIKAGLAEGEETMVKVKTKNEELFKNTISNARSNSQTTASGPTRPMGLKRKSEQEVIDIDDDDDQPVLKRRQLVQPSAQPQQPRPWDIDHTNKKIPVPPAAQPKSQKPKIGIDSKIELSPEQQGILKIVMEGSNVFFTGSAGTGKSVLLRHIIKNLKSKYVRSADAVAITASTGIAACNIGGTTVHSFGGIGLGQEAAPQLAAKIRRNQKAMSRWVRTKALIIDEISMLEGDLFDKLEHVARILRKSQKPFGGIQVILTGDFFQLPPVTKGQQPNFAFNAACWSTCIDRTLNLHKVFRQKDQDFVDMLNEMRFGKLTQRSIQLFSGRSRPLPNDGIEATELFPRRDDVDRANKSRMDQLQGNVVTYKSVDGGVLDEKIRERMLANFMAPKELQLKIGSQVMMIKNIDETLVNGSVGKVVDFMREDEVGKNDVPEPEDEKKSAPTKKATGSRFPLVEFSVPGQPGKTFKHLVMPEIFKVEGSDGRAEVSRSQLPLVLAWAMSIHKSQGQTLEKVKVDLTRVFEKGQAYVAISRATSLEGLQIIGFKPEKVMAHPAVIAWSKTLEALT